MENMEERKLALAKYLDVDPDSIEIEYNRFTIDNEEYRVLTDDEADSAVYDDIENLVDELGMDAFNEDYIDVTEYIENMDFFDDTLHESNSFYIDDIKNEISDDDSYATRLVEECIENDILAEEDLVETNEGLDFIDDESKYRAMELYVEYLDEINEPAYDWFKSIYGSDAIKNLIKSGDLILNIKDLTEAVIYSDGRGPSLASYDGEEIELDDDYYAYRTN